MNHAIRSPEDLALVIRAVRKSTGVRQDDLAAVVGVSQQFAVDVERGKPTVQFGRVLRLLEELGVVLTVDLPEEASRKLEELRSKAEGAPPGRRRAKTKPAATATPSAESAQPFDGAS